MMKRLIFALVLLVFSLCMMSFIIVKHKHHPLSHNRTWKEFWKDGIKKSDLKVYHIKHTVLNQSQSVNK